MEPKKQRRNLCMWDNLIYISLDFFIQDYRFQEEFIWDVNNNSSEEIKQFAIELVKENIMNNDNSYKEGIHYMTFDYLDACGDFITFKIKQSIQFYKKYEPIKMLKNGMFGKGNGIEDEFLIPITIDIKNNFTDEFLFDIINEENSPEAFAKQISIEKGLNDESASLIAMQIRRHIHEYVVNLFKTMSIRIVNSEKEIKSKNRSRNRGHQKKGDSNWYQQRTIEKIASEPELMEPSLSEQLGKKRKRD